MSHAEDLSLRVSGNLNLAESPEDPRPLVIDLDGTLTSSDTLHEGLLALAATDPMALRHVPAWLKQGKAGFKSALADRVTLDPADLPMNDAVVALATRARNQGRSVLLVSASDQRQVDRIANALGVFDEAIGSDGSRNLSAGNKAAWLTERFGEGGFVYVGNSTDDLPVWKAAGQVVSVGADAKLQRQIDQLGLQDEILVPAATPKTRLRAHIKAMRPHQWLKNMLVLVPALAAHQPGALVPSLFAFVAFCLAASAIYLVNDMLDLPVDRRHPRKCKRPIAAGTVSVAGAVVQAAGLMTASMLIAILVSPLLFGVLIGYLVLTTAYSLYLKRKLMIDIWMLGALYTMRIIAGGVASGVVLSEWLLAFSMFVFLALAAVKRQSELADLAKRGKVETDGRGYKTTDLPVVLGVALAAGYCSVLVLALYISSDAVRGLYGQPAVLWLACPLLLYWISRTTIISHRGEMDDDPIVFAIKDRVSQLVFATGTAIFVIGALV